MAQYDFGVIDPQTKNGTQLADDLNQWRNAVHSSHSGTARPAYAVAGTVWMDTTAGGKVLKLYDGTADIALAVLSGGNTFSGNQTISGNLVFNGASRRIQGDYSTAIVDQRTAFQSWAANANSVPWILPNGTANSAGIGFSNSSIAANAAFGSLSIDASVVGLYSNKLGTGTTLPLIFDVAGERVRLTTLGGVLIGTMTPPRTDAAGRLQVAASTGSDAPVVVRNGNSAAGKNWQFGPNDLSTFVIYNQANVGQYMADGGTSWTATSDERLKTDLAPIENASEKLLGVRTATFRFHTDDPSVRRAGFIAQDWLQALPEVVMQLTPNDYLGLMYAETTVLVAAAVKEQIARVDALEARLAALEV